MSTNYIDQITDTAGTTHDISEGDSTRIFRATCSTAAGTTAKVATLQTSNRNFSLATGVRVAVTFTYGNSATTPTLNVNSTGAKTIATPTAVATLTTGNGTTYNTWGPYETIIFTYNGTYWVKSGSSLGAYTGQPISMATSTGTSSITLDHGTKYSLSVGGNSYIFTTPTDNNSGGTVTSVGITAGSGISVSGSPITTSGSITVSHSNSVTAQTTQAVYPIKIDAQGHISAYGSAVTIPTVPSNIVNTITTTAGAHTAITSQKGDVSFNIPTNTSHLTNDSGFITTDSDENVKSTAVTTASTYYLTGSSSSTTVTGGLNKHASISAYVTADSSTSGSASIIIGNSTPSGTAGAKDGYLRLYGSTAYRHDIKAYGGYPAANRTIYLPRYTSTMYLTCVSTTSAVGGATTAPVYVDNTGRINAVTSIPYTLLSGAPTVSEVEIVRW